MNCAAQNNETTSRLIDAIADHFAGEVGGKRFAFWGVSNVAGEIDESTCAVMEWLVANDAQVCVHDAAVVKTLKARFGVGAKVEFSVRKWDTVRNAHAVVIASHQATYTNVDAGRLTWSVAERTLFDVYGTVDRDSLQYSSFTHYALNAPSFCKGRTAVATSDQPKSILNFAIAA